jgi:hypothetical protein
MIMQMGNPEGGPSGFWVEIAIFCRETHRVVADIVATVFLIGHACVGRGGTVDQKPYVKFLMKFAVT